ncbi:putative quinol monooxygenase [Carnobacterium sp.]|uniref:putative quinol monooxygenase n=1 Tax=Carnobacterium sp. TaxID=48221 RepID=UPI0030740B7C
MKIINATFYILENKRADFLTDIKALIESAKLEAGCIDYHLYESIEEANKFVMVESWANQEAINEHNKNPLLLNLFKNIAHYSSKQPIIKISTLEE